MFKVAFGLLVISAALSAGVIQVSPYEFDVTASGTPTGTLGSFTAIYDVQFYYAGPTTAGLHVAIIPVDSSGTGCPTSGFPSCDVGLPSAPP